MTPTRPVRRALRRLGPRAIEWALWTLGALLLVAAWVYVRFLFGVGNDPDGDRQRIIVELTGLGIGLLAFAIRSPIVWYVLGPTSMFSGLWFAVAALMVSTCPESDECLAGAVLLWLSSIGLSLSGPGALGAAARQLLRNRGQATHDAGSQPGSAPGDGEPSDRGDNG